MTQKEDQAINQDALHFHTGERPGKIEVISTKPLTNQRDLSLAYSPGVAAPCLEIYKNPKYAYTYTSKGNLVAVMSNGSAVLGLGDLGALASKPVMEGKAVLFKRFADIDAIDLEIDTRDIETFIQCAQCVAPSFGGINLEDIKAPDCFIIEKKLIETLHIPVFHDDQHGTAVIACAGLINAADISGRSFDTMKLVINGAGASAIACAALFRSLGVKSITMCDTKGVLYQGRSEGMNPWKQQHVIETSDRTLEEAMVQADVFVGLSIKGAVSPEMVKSMAAHPIIFALANPDPEITPEEIKAVRGDAIIATGRSDYPNQINNVLGFPYIFRGALDVRAYTINEEMKIAAANALAKLARTAVPDEVDQAYSGKRLQYGPEYIIPVPFDPRLIVDVPSAVAQAAIQTEVAQKQILDFQDYHHALRVRLDPTRDTLQLIFEKIKSQSKRIIFSEGEEEYAIRAAVTFQEEGYGIPLLIGRQSTILEKFQTLGIEPNIQIHNASTSNMIEIYTDHLYKKSARHGLLYRDCQRLINQDRNVFGALMLLFGQADGMVTGLTRSFASVANKVFPLIEPLPDKRIVGLTVLATRNQTVIIADTKIEQKPSSEDLAHIAIQTAETAKQLGLKPRVALLSFSNFGQSLESRAQDIRKAVEILDSYQVSFEYDGEIAADVALDYPLMKKVYPFCRLTGAANVLIMPSLHAAHISSRLLQKFGSVQIICHQIIGLSRAVQFVQMSSNVSEMVTAAALAAYDSLTL